MNAPTPLESSGIVPPAPHVTLPRFGLLLVGDELLSGRRADQHVPKTIELLAARGLTLSYVHMVGDARADISAQLAPILKSGDVVFSCGGIGATPDDQTRQAAAEAAGVPLALHPQAEALIGQRFAELAAQKGIPFEPDSADHQQRLQMGVFPQGAQIVPNPYNRIPGFSLGHVHFFPGFPAMAWPMMEWTLDTYYSFWFDQRAWAENAVVVKSASEAMLTPNWLRKRAFLSSRTARTTSSACRWACFRKGRRSCPIPTTAFRAFRSGMCTSFPASPPWPGP